MVDVIIKGFNEARREIDKAAKQARYAGAVAINETAKQVQGETVGKFLPGKFTLRSKGQPWQKPGGKLGFNIKFAKKDNLTATLGSQADWLKLQETGGTKQVSGKSLAIEAGARESKTSVLLRAMKPRRLLGGKKPKAFVIETAKGPSVFQRVGAGLKLLYAFRKTARISKALRWEKWGGERVKALFDGNFEKAFAKAMATAKK